VEPAVVSVDVVMAREPIPAGGPSLFLAGPTALDPALSWRPAAIGVVAAHWTGARELTVLNPESRGGRRAARYEDQVDWEFAARGAAGAILFWIPRDMVTMPGMTTNVEFGLDVRTGKAVLGAPPDCPDPDRNRYLVHVASRYGVPVRTTLADAVITALEIIATSASG
jgi:hypothetical protein